MWKIAFFYFVFIRLVNVQFGSERSHNAGIVYGQRTGYINVKLIFSIKEAKVALNIVFWFSVVSWFQTPFGRTQISCWTKKKVYNYSILMQQTLVKLWSWAQILFDLALTNFLSFQFMVPSNIVVRIPYTLSLGEGETT